MKRATTFRRAVLAVGALCLPLVLSADAAGTEDPCVTLTPTSLGAFATYNVIVGTDNDDQIIGSSIADVIFGGAGDDILKGNGGNDVLCGQTGHDGLNGGLGDDILGGGSGNDLLVGGDDQDELYGGGGHDGVYGGLGNDAVSGDYGATDDGDYDYLAGGAGTDDMRNRSGDDSFHDIQPVPATCPNGMSKRMGAYGAWRNIEPRLDPQGSNPCKQIRGVVRSVNAPNENDGDLHLVVEDGNGKRWVVEFMPRDFKPFPLLEVGNDVELDGLHVIDGHGKEEIHPVFRVKRLNTGAVSHSGPRHAGHAENRRPGNVITCAICEPRDSHRFCWDENGEPCTAWATIVEPSGTVEPFKVLTRKLHADLRRDLALDLETYQ